MTTDQKTIALLQTIGLSEYVAKACAALRFSRLALLSPEANHVPVP
jgi:hypothetical protein